MAMKRTVFYIILALAMVLGLSSAYALKADADETAPMQIWVKPSEENNLPARIDAFQNIFREEGAPVDTCIYQLYLPGNAEPDKCFLSWEGDAKAMINGNLYDSGSCPIPPIGAPITYSFTGGDGDELSMVTYQGSESVVPVFIDIDETYKEEGETEPHTIAAMDSDKNNYCVGKVVEGEKHGINIDGTWYGLNKIKGRGNVTWDLATDKCPYNVTLDSKINFPGIDSEKTKKWSFLAEILDHSLLCNRSGYQLAYQQGIGQDTASADVWMNGEYQGCYTVTPKTDSYVTKNGFMIEQDNYLQNDIGNFVEGSGDPQFALDGLLEPRGQGWDSSPAKYNRISVKKMGDNLLGKNEAGEVDESPGNLIAKATLIRDWLQDAWDAMRSNTGYNNNTGKYYTDYIDIESFAKMYLMQEYIKNFDICAGSILFYRDGMTEDDKLIAGPLWDLDNAMGSTYQNANLGNADDRINGDRRSGEGSFIQNLIPENQYKTSIFKTLSKHEDFMEEVTYQYNMNRDFYDALPQNTEQLISDIADSARMNHYKVNEITSDTGMSTNDHYYSTVTTLGSGEYEQKFRATTDSKTDWDNYAANLKTYITARSLWFHNNFAVEPGTVNGDFGSSAGGKYTITTEGQSEAFSGRHSCTLPGYSEVTVTAVPDAGYLFKGWYEATVGEDGSVTPDTDKMVSSDPEYKIKVYKENVCLYALFECPHDWNDGEVTREATYNEEGEKLFTCAICGREKTELIPKKARVSIAKASVSGVADKTWTGAALTQNPVVKLSGTTLKKDTDYTIAYKNNKNVGKATVTVSGKGKYSGTIARTFLINPKGTIVSKLKKGSKAVTVKWKKQTAKMSASRINGYQIQVSTNSAFTKNKKTVNVKGYKKASRKITRLKAKKKYYVRIRTYKTVGGVKYYSPWSKVKTVRVK